MGKEHLLSGENRGSKHFESSGVKGRERFNLSRGVRNDLSSGAVVGHNRVPGSGPSSRPMTTIGALETDPGNKGILA